LAAKALEYIGGLYEIERETKDLPPDMRREIRQTKANPLPMRCISGCWPIARKPDGSGTAKALDYSLKRWEALTRYLDDGAVPIDNNWVENQIRPWRWGAAIGCLRVHCAVVNVCGCGHDPNTVSEAESA
jgi:hypothetical protein